MAIDSKYGEVILEHGSHIPDDEPVIVFRASDVNLPQLLQSYHHLCKNTSSPQAHLDLITDSYHQIMEWQHEHQDQVKAPTSAHYTERMEASDDSE